MGQSQCCQKSEKPASAETVTVPDAGEAPAAEAEPEPKQDKPAEPTAATSPPGPESKNYTITLEKSTAEDKIGADVARNQAHLVVLKVKAGLIQDHNTNNPGQEVMPYDQIMDVNGTSGDSNEILKVIASAPKLVITFTRPAPKEH
eukprot:CAMPEP_0179207430 /NCGR_PEP_ID=MMETSP0796-20121207/103436_1 /TAXON_ID=73915 /ORGANISM="Pyrodinium bahamense, Strain pbaha01" /LENGTH=145 /DNA_ID=CAMNT_0020912361 /DNA_START=15 /DNA_END=452 /DNA_ORIENTATION=+